MQKYFNGIEEQKKTYRDEMFNYALDIDKNIKKSLVANCCTQWIHISSDLIVNYPNKLYEELKISSSLTGR